MDGSFLCGIKKNLKEGFMYFFNILLILVLVLSGCTKVEEVSNDNDNSKVYSWKLVTAWPPNLPVNHEITEEFARDIELMSKGQLKIKVFNAGELIPALQVFDAVSQGAVQMGFAASYYWSGKIPASQIFTVVPFGMTEKGSLAWIKFGGGLELWRELYEPFGVVPFPMGSTGVQMGGWFNKKIDSMKDIQGLKMRIPGLGGKVIAKAGGNPILLSAAELYTALERGTIDATEWVGPLHDKRFGLDRIAKYYYYPGWHEPGPQMEMIINKKAWSQLPSFLQKIVEGSIAKSGLNLSIKNEAKNALALKEIEQQGKVELIQFPEGVLEELRALTEEVLEEEASKDEGFRKVLASYKDFQKIYVPYEHVTRKAYDESRN